MRLIIYSFLLWAFPCFASYLIGSGISDVTGPAAEVGMMGYAKFDQTVAGIHTRLRSRAFVFVDPNTNQRVVFVSADLGHIFQSIKNGVIEELKKKYGNLYTDENVMLSAIHTHSGPGGYAHEILYNITSLGYIDENYHAIVNGIVESIEIAHNNLASGKIYINRGEVLNASKNRSPDAYANNPEFEKQAYPYLFDTRMTMLKLVGEQAEIGMINWFPLHNVSMSNLNHLISSDNKGYASYLFEKRKGTDHLAQKGFVAAFAQSNEGDVSPTVNNEPDDPHHNDFMRTYDAALKQYIVAKELYETASEPVEGNISYRHAYIDLSNIEVENSTNGIYRTCTASLGYSFAAGTKDGQGASFFEEGSLVSNPFIDAVTSIVANPGADLKACQFPKPILLAAGIARPLPWTISILPIQIFKIGKLAIVGVPAEFTTMAGRRLKQTVKEVFQDDVTDIVIAGLSNSYSGYVTTPEEYAIQRYEAGFTLFGSQTLPAYQKKFMQLAQDLKNNTQTFKSIRPPDYSDIQVTLQTGVVLDDVPLSSKFGGIVQQPADSYSSSETVEVKFWGGHPKNNLRRNNTFLVVEKREGNSWNKVADDGDWSTIYHWKRVGASHSHVTISWEIPINTPSGEYRIRHFGDYKNGWNGKIYPYEGVSRSFFVEK